jgi:hypothetical protein
MDVSDATNSGTTSSHTSSSSSSSSSSNQKGQTKGQGQNIIIAPTKEVDSDSEDEINVENMEVKEGDVIEDEKWPPRDG